MFGRGRHTRATTAMVKKVIGRHMVSMQGEKFLIQAGEFFQLDYWKEGHLF